MKNHSTHVSAHAYYIGDNGFLSNTYYIAPCIPAVLRAKDNADAAGDVINQPLST